MNGAYDCVQIRLIVCEDCLNLAVPTMPPLSDKGRDWERECFCCRTITTYWVDYNAFGYIEVLQQRVRRLLSKIKNQ